MRRRMGMLLAFTAAMSLGFSLPAQADEPEPPGEQVELTKPDGTTFTAVPQGNRYLVDESVDPDGFIMNRDASGEQARTEQAAPPACVDVSLDEPGIVTQTVRATNNCAITQRVKFLIAFAPDSECLIAARGQQVSHAFPIQGTPGRFDGVESC